MPRYFPKIQRLLLEHYGLRYEPDLVMAVFVPNDIGDTALGIDALKPSSKEGFLLSQRAQQLGRPGTWLYIHYRTARVLVGGYFSRAESSKGKTEQRRVTDEDLEKALVTVADEYKRMQDIATSSEARFVLVHIPQDDLSPTAGARLRSLVGDKVDVFIDVLPYMAAVQTQTGRGLYWPKDRHPNSDGYEVVARALARELTGRRLVPSREMSFLGQR